MLNQRLAIALILALLAVLALALVTRESVTGDMLANFLYLTLLMSLIASRFVSQPKSQLVKTLRDLLIWGGIIGFIMVIYTQRAVVGL